jgi:phospholipase/carboxylesterase
MTEPLSLPESKSGLSYRIRVPQKEQKLSVIMLHGLGGDDKSMWVLESAFPEDSLIVAPRGLYVLGEGSYSWVNPRVSDWPALSDLRTSVRALEALVDELAESIGLLRDRLVIMGFSQGAALAFAAAVKGTIDIKALIAVAAFLPGGDLSALNGVPIFWGHGIEDEEIPISHAREGVKRLQEYEARVHFCEADVGHKLGVECLHGLEVWLDELANTSEEEIEDE